MSNNNDPAPANANLPGYDAVTLADFVGMVWRHRRGIIVFTVLVTAIVAGVTLMSPRPYQASALMEVMPEYSSDSRVDKDQFATMVLTQLEIAKSPVIGMRVFQRFKAAGVDMTFPELMAKAAIVRPPKTSIIQCSISLPSAESALAIVDAWRQETLREVDRKSMEKALIFVMGRLKDLQEGWLNYAAAVNEARRNAEQLENKKLITVSRSVDDQVLWQDLVKASESNAFQRMSDLQLKSEQMNPEYLAARNRLAEIEQSAAGAIMSREFYIKVVEELESRLHSMSGAPVSTGADKPDEVTREALAYVDALAKAKEVLALGDPVVYRGARGALKKTALAGFGALALACMIAFLYEWGRQAGWK